MSHHDILQLSSFLNQQIENETSKLTGLTGMCVS